jgi:integrase/recombinase XerD
MAQAATLSEQQLQRLLAAAARTQHPLRNRCVLLMTHWAGMRVGEVAALLWGDVVDAGGQVREELRLRAAQTKGDRARVVLINQRLQAELTRYVAANAPRSADLPFFATQRAAGFTANTLTHIVNALYQRAGIDGGSSHSGRRTFITNLAERGISVRVLQHLASHANISTTQKYIDVRPSMLRSAVELV